MHCKVKNSLRLYKINPVQFLQCVHLCVSLCYLFFLVEKLVEIGKEILQKNNITDLNDVR